MLDVSQSSGRYWSVMKSSSARGCTTFSLKSSSTTNNASRSRAKSFREDLDVPILLRKASLTFLETALLLFLRQRLTQADAQGERAVVSLDEMQEHLSVFERDSNPDHAKFERQMVNAVDKAKKLSLLQFIRGSGERYEVSPTLKLLFSAEEIQALTRTYAALPSAPPTTADGEEIENEGQVDNTTDEEAL